MAVFSRYREVLNADGTAMTMREALALINATLDEVLAEQAAAALVAELGAEAEVARDLAYRLYLVSERRGRAADARMYNGLVQSWPEIARLAQQAPSVAAAQSQMFEMAGPDDPA